MKPSVMHSVSLSIKGDESQEYEDLSDLFTTPPQVIQGAAIHDSDYSYQELFRLGSVEHIGIQSFQVDIQQDSISIEAHQAAIRWKTNFLTGQQVPSEYMEPLLPQRPSREEWAPTWAFVVYQTMVDSSALRFFEIWQRGTAEKFRRGFLGTGSLLRTFAGKVGANNQKMPGGKGMLSKSDTGEWSVIDIKRLYPRMKHLPPEGIINARKVAYKLAEQKGK